MSNATLSPLAQQLLEAQVKFFVDRVNSEFHDVITLEVADFYEKGKTSTLSDWLPSEDVHALAKYYLTEMPIAPELAERLQRIALRIYHHPQWDELRWQNIIDKKELSELIDLAFSLQASTRIIRRVTRNKLVINAVSDMMYRGIAGFVSQSTAKAEQVASTIPGAGSMFKLGRSVVGKATSGFEKSAEDNIKRYISHNIEAIVKSSEKRLENAMEDGTVKAALLRSWEQIKAEPIASLRQYASEQDIKDSINGGMEFWLNFRKTPYMQDIISYVVRYTYQYADQITAAELLDELGLEQEFISQELTRISEPFLQHWHSKGWLEAFFSRQLTPFWQQADAQGWLPN